VHTEAIGRMPRWFEAVFNTPSHHRVHHGSNPRYLDRNYGGILIVWDRIFGTFQAEEEPVVYGLTKDIDTYNPLRIAFHEYAAIGRDLRGTRSWADRMRILLRGPGWRPASPLAAAGSASSPAS
jgi:sterol desaturase/sphingolipid hydroxylase (fatty acid hydroxylase superfamily)